MAKYGDRKRESKSFLGLFTLYDNKPSQPHFASFHMHLLIVVPTPRERHFPRFEMSINKHPVIMIFTVVSVHLGNAPYRITFIQSVSFLITFSL